ncbi:MAG TPA: alpha-amylase family glycosyl hydrolase [Candidatus Brocadiia bacterium]|nr:alpha-amylase family glycosyl hydrolase [Candidatus Brocadiia bacterium]
MNKLIPAVFLTPVIFMTSCSSSPDRLKMMGPTFDQTSGNWRGLAVSGFPSDIMGSADDSDFEMNVEGGKWPPAREWKAKPVETGVENGHASYRLTRSAGDWVVTVSFTVIAEKNLVGRSVSARWNGKTPVKVKGAVMRIPGVSLCGAADAVWSLPGNYPYSEKKLIESVPGRSTREHGWTWSDTGVAVVRSESLGIGLVAAYELVDDGANPSVEERSGCVSIAHRFHTLALLNPGDEVSVGVQWLRLVEGGSREIRLASGELSDCVNHGPPADRPAWLTGAVLEELHPWGRLETWGAGDRGSRMPDIEVQLPYHKRLGVDGVWLLPVSNKPPWVYFLPKFRNLDEQVTTSEQLKSFVAAGHKLGIRTMFDIVTYGVCPDSPETLSIPDSAWCLDESGNRCKVWGNTVLAADCADPDWRKVTLSRGEWWVGQFGADGFRLDCAGLGQVPNWRPGTGRKASAAMLAGGVGQNELLRSAIRKINSDAVLLPEGGHTCMFRSGDLLFDYPFYMVCREITRQPDTVLWVRRAREWLSAQQHTHSPLQQASLVRFLANHDTVAAQDFFGVGPSQALVALNALIPGVLLLHQEQEIGFAVELSEWLRLRHILPELREGTCDYECVESSEGRVLAFLRYTETDASIIAVNFAADDVDCRIRVKCGAWESYNCCRNALNGHVLSRGESIRIPAYRPVVIQLSRRPIDSSLAVSDTRKAVTGGKTLVLEGTIKELGSGITRYSYAAGPAMSWFVETSEGLLHDKFFDRHRKTKPGETHVDATPPLARCWRPIEHGLWSGLDAASIGVVLPDGRAREFRLKNVTGATLARIEAAPDGSSVEIIAAGRFSAPPFEISEWPAAVERMAALRRSRPDIGIPGVEVDPLWVKFANQHYSVAFSRRHGGTIHALSRRDGASFVESSEIYTDFGLYETGTHVATEWETNPGYGVEREGERTAITFTGCLRRPAWNGVHAGGYADPRIKYRIRYLVDSSPVIRVEFGVIPVTDRMDVNAFLAYRIPFVGVREWQCDGDGATASGAPGPAPGKRLFECVNLKDAGSAEFRLVCESGAAVIRAFAGRPEPPQNPFLLDSGPGGIQLYFAMLTGNRASLPANSERQASFEIVVK